MHKSFTVGSGKSREKGAPPRGTTIRFELSEPATLTIAILRRRTGKSCHRTPRAIRCLVPEGQFTAVGATGADNLPFTGRLEGKALTPGRYLLRATASSSGLDSPTVTTGFRILPPAH